MEEHERHILMLISKGDVKAFEELFFLYQPKLVNFLEALTHDREISRDMAQEIFNQLNEGILSNAANITKDDQLIEFCSWMVKL